MQPSTAILSIVSLGLLFWLVHSSIKLSEKTEKIINIATLGLGWVIYCACVLA